MEQDFRENHRKAYRTVDVFKKAYNPKSYFCRNKDRVMIIGKKDVHKRWRDCFKHLLNLKQMQVADQPIQLEEGEKEDSINLPTIEEITRAVRKTKNKAPGIDNILRKLIKYGGEALVIKLHELFNEI